MEQVCRDNDSSSHLAENPDAPRNQESSLLTTVRRESDADDPTCSSRPPSKTDSRRAGKSPPRFERPSPSNIAILTVLCLLVYPVFYVLKIAAKDKSLFVVRLIVSAWCSGTGFALEYILLRIGAQHLGATSGFMLVGC